MCPRYCKADRIKVKGFCNAGLKPVVAKCMIHKWEEPPISGIRGSGAVFFTGCNLRCVYCQNFEISQNYFGDEITVEDLAGIFLKLQDMGVHNINLVTPSHFIFQIAESIKISRENGLKIPIVYNSNAYENIDSLRLMEGLVDIYLPDIKYFDNEMAYKYSGVKNYFTNACKAVLEMYRQVGNLKMDSEDIAQSGLIIRHLVLPGQRKDSMCILDWIKENIPSSYVSLMSQYVPVNRAYEYNELNRKITTFEYDSVIKYFFKIGLKNGFMQEKTAALKDYIPDF
jgi:putative pyruvate formate lyase activating enzyme